MASITLINLSKLKSETHVQFNENVLTLMATTTPKSLKIESLYPLYRTAFDNELEAFNFVTKSDFTVQITQQDQIRDSIYRGFYDNVKSYRNHYDAAYRVEANLLWDVLLRYGNLGGKTLDNQTAAVNDLIRELQKPKLAAALTTLQLDGWVTRLEIENSTFHTLMMQRYNEPTNKTAHRMKNTRVETDRYYRAIVANIENQVLAGENKTVLANFLTELNSIVRRFKNILAQEYGRKNAGGSVKEETDNKQR